MRRDESSVDKQFVARVDLDRHRFRRGRVVPALAEIQAALFDGDD